MVLEAASTFASSMEVRDNSQWIRYFFNNTEVLKGHLRFGHRGQREVPRLTHRIVDFRMVTFMFTIT